MHSQSTEDYLKAIHKLGAGTGEVTTSALARQLGIGDGSVTGMLKKLSAKKLIRYVPYRGVSLTAAGRKMAVTMTRRHRLWEIFLAWSVIIAERGGSTAFQLVCNKNRSEFDRKRWIGERGRLVDIRKS